MRLHTYLLATLYSITCICSADQYREMRANHAQAQVATLLSQECTSHEYRICARLLNRQPLTPEDKEQAIEKIAHILEQRDRHRELDELTLRTIMDILEQESETLHEISDQESLSQTYEQHTEHTTTKRSRSINSPTPGTKLQFGNGNIDGADTIGANKLQGDAGLTFDYDTGGAGKLSYAIQSNGTSIVVVNDSGLNVNAINDNGSGSITMNNSLDLNGNTITDSSSSDITLGTALNADTNSIKGLTSMNASTASTLTVQTSTNSNTTSETANIKLDATTAESGDTAHIVLSGGNSGSGTGNIQVTAGDLDVQTQLTNSGGDVTLASALDANGNAIKDSGNALILDGAGNSVQVASTSSGFDLNGNNISDSNGDITLGSAMNANTNNIIDVGSLSGTAGSDLTVSNASSGSGSDTSNITIDASAAASGDTANLVLSGGSSGSGSGDVQVSAGMLDVQTGTVENTTGNLTVTTSSGNVTLNPAADIDASNNVITGLAKATRDSNDITIETTTSGNVILNPSADIDASSNNIKNVSAVNNDSANLLLETTTSGDISLAPVGDINVNNTKISNANTIDGGTGANVTIQTATASNTSDDTKSVTIDATETEDASTTGGNGDTANIELNVGANNGNLITTNLKSGSGTALVIDASGNVLSESSSQQFKRNITACDDDVADKALELQPVSFTRVSTGDREIGLIAEDVERVLPEIVTRDQNGAPYSIMYQRITPVLLAAVQKQQRIIDAHEYTIYQQQELINELYVRYASLQHEVQQLRNSLSCTAA